jgi:hypothetical protein
MDITYNKFLRPPETQFFDFRYDFYAPDQEPVPKPEPDLTLRLEHTIPPVNAVIAV